MSTATRRRASRTEEIPVSFDVKSDDFTVPGWPGLRCSATYDVSGTVELDHSGDSVTPDCAPYPRVSLMESQAYEIHLVHDDLDIRLPPWLEERLVIDGASEFDAAFLEAVGGQGALDQQAVDIACGN